MRQPRFSREAFGLGAACMGTGDPIERVRAMGASASSLSILRERLPPGPLERRSHALAGAVVAASGLSIMVPEL